MNVPSRDRESTFKSFLSAYLECIVYVCKRLHQPGPDGHSIDELSGGTLSESIATVWIGKALDEAVRGGFVGKLSNDTAGTLVGKSIKQLEQIKPGMFFNSTALL